MTSSNSSNEFHYWFNPQVDEIGHSVYEFLQLLGRPTHIHIPGENSGRHRAVVTLLHGNEPSGLSAIYKLLQNSVTPIVDIHYFIVNVRAALEAPGFYYRMLPGLRDLNRCFGKIDTSDEPGQLAKNLLDNLYELKPEAIIDIHNTSGSGPAFAVTTFMDDRHDALVSLFTNRLIVTDLDLGALMEISETLCPTVTIECGGAQDEESNLLAHDGLLKYITTNNVLHVSHADIPLEYFHNPVRLELQEPMNIFYGEYAMDADALTLTADVESHNFGTVDSSTTLGFLRRELLNNLIAIDTQGNNILHENFTVVGNELRPTRPLRLFMVTGNPVIAKNDCLFYFIQAQQ